MKSIFLFACLCLSTTIFGQGNIVTPDPITNPLHFAHIGEITFMQGNIPMEQYKEADFLKSFDLKPKSNLSIRVFMGNSITNYLHALAPEMPADSLIKKGNYQFTFYVDGKPIYTENLHPGAGLHKHTTTFFNVPLVSTKGEDSWGRSLWERFKMHGGEAALTDGTHRLAIEIRPYLITQKQTLVGNLIAKGQLQLVIKPIIVTEAEKAIQKVLPAKGWVISKQPYNHNIITELNIKIAQYAFKEISGIVAVYNNELLIEEYFDGADRNTLHDPRSVGKTFASTLMGMAIHDGYIADESQKLESFYDLKNYAHYSPVKAQVKISDLLTMGSAFDGSDMDGDSPGNEENMYPTENWVKFTLDLPMDSKKTNGAQWDYFTAGVVILGDILNKSVPGGLEKYAADKLFTPLGITHYQWQYTPQQVPNTAGGIQLTALDFAKYGLLYQNKGKWKGKQLLPESWVNKSFTRHLSIPERANEFYGYLFWNKTYHVDGKAYEAYYCSGNGGNRIIIFKDLPLTVVILAKAYNKAYAHPQADKIVEEYLLRAIVGKTQQ